MKEVLRDFISTEFEPLENTLKRILKLIEREKQLFSLKNQLLRLNSLLKEFEKNRTILINQYFVLYKAISDLRDWKVHPDMSGAEHSKQFQKVREILSANVSEQASILAIEKAAADQDDRQRTKLGPDDFPRFPFFLYASTPTPATTAAALQLFEHTAIE